MIFERYLFRTVLTATLFVAVSLACVIFLTQSLRFLELVIDSGASSATFWILTLLALPRFFEIILPIALMAGTVFVYNKMIMDSELVVMRSTGTSPLMLARPALYVCGIVTAILWFMTTWLGPVSLAQMQQMRQVVKAQYSTLLLREGVFNAVVPGLTVYIRDKDKNGGLNGIVIHDSRPENDVPVTVLAKRGIVVATDEGQQVLVYEGSRQNLNEKTGGLDKLDFERYSIDFPEGNGVVRQRWRKPDERTFFELLNPDIDNERDLENKDEFIIEAHRRIISPLLAPAFVLIALSFLLLGPIDRRGQSGRILLTIISTICIQGLYLAAFNLSQKNAAGLFLMYFLVLAPIVFCSWFLAQGTGAFPWRMAVKSSGGKGDDA